MRLAPAVLIALLVSLALAASANAVAPTVSSLGGKRVEAQFVEPDTVADHEDEMPVLERIKQMILDVPPGGTIAMGIYSYNYTAIGDALATAKGRGVNVYVVESGDQDKLVGQAQELHDQLGTSHRFCGTSAPTNDSCNSSWDPSIQHAKYAIFTQTRDTSGVLQSNVVWFGTANLTRETGAQSMNDTITVYGDTELYNDFFWDLFLPMWSQNPRVSGFTPSANPATQPVSHFFTSPTTGIEIKASPSEPHELLVDELNKISTGSNCQIRVLEASFRRSDVAMRLRDMRAGGCAVQVLLGTDVGCTALGILQSSPGLQIKQALNTPIHSKTVITLGAGGNQSVFTGSHNVLARVSKNDELLARLPVNGNPIYTAYVNYFNHGWSIANPTTGLICAD
jgi:hypothetical protein